ncbi:MBL fold metallo-hydrolase [Corallococcus sicarius]|uniref:MBL fold metallo-hydrolase n=1 Tax=Corallococcus sicarius TaxID=2316726 RepID=UPI0013157B3F|nr:MBL fold metallo-hydrolase [Corallococcus sicarius]
MWNLNGFYLWVDPGPGALVRALENTPSIAPAGVDALYLSHNHLDHTCDANVVIEAMTNGGDNKRGSLLAPADALGNEPAVSSYTRAFVNSVETLGVGKSFSLASNVSLHTPLAHHHGVETYGYRIHLPNIKVAHIVDTLWMDSLCDAYAGVDVLIINTTLLDARLNVLHLSIKDAERLIVTIRPRIAFLTHLGKKMLEADPMKLAKQLTEKTGVTTIAAQDGMLFDLSQI